jgi:hypothetical protein
VRDTINPANKNLSILPATAVGKLSGPTYSFVQDEFRLLVTVVSVERDKLELKETMEAGFMEIIPEHVQQPRTELMDATPKHLADACRMEGTFWTIHVTLHTENQKMNANEREINLYSRIRNHADR